MTASIKEDEALGESIILNYKTGNPAGVATYQKVCRTIDNIENWLPEGVTQFLEQFVNIGYLLDAKCKLLVEKLAGISWHVIPSDTRLRFVQMLCELAVHFVCHTETILSCFVTHLLPKVRPAPISKDAMIKEGAPTVPKFETVVTEEEQNAIYQKAHDAIKFVLRCFPMTVRLVEKTLRRNFPHFNAPLIRYVSFVRNLFLVAEYAVDIRPEMWKLLFEHLAQLDSVVSKNILSAIPNREEQQTNDSFGVFFLDEEAERINVERGSEGEEREEKLDRCMCYVLAYISRAHGVSIQPELAPLVDWLPADVPKDGLYLYLRDAFEAHLLLAPGLKCAPYALFYFLSLDQKYVNNFTEWLWSFVLSPSQSPNDWKKAQGAVCYLGSLLSRASFIETKYCLGWMERLAKWCTRYVNELVGGSAAATAGTLRHGAFYAVCQALLVTFSFRYNEVVSADELETVRRWSLGHIIHSSLQPLRYINYSVAVNFAAISRVLQLVYCNHVLPQTFDDGKAAFEPFFPFEHYLLLRSSLFVRGLTLSFSPLAEDAADLRWQNASRLSGAMSFQDQSETGSLDFLEDLKRDREIMNDDRRGLWPLLSSPHFEYSMSKFSASPISSSFISSSLMDTN